MNKILLILLSSVLQFSYAQNNDIFSRLSAIENNGTTFYNIDGINVSSKEIFITFDKENIDKIFKENNIKESDAKANNELLGVENYRFVDKVNINDSIIRVVVDYLIRNKKDRITTVSFNQFNTANPIFEHKMIDLILNKAIPDSCFSNLVLDTVNFAGRKLNQKDKCQWMGVNNVQCPYNGQMNWSVHNNKESADLINEVQFALLKDKEGGKVESIENVNIIFEGMPTTAKKVKYVLTGLTSALASMTGGTELTIYYISEKVRGNYVSCTLSHWNNDNLRASGLPPLLEEVISIENPNTIEIQESKQP